MPQTTISSDERTGGLKYENGRIWIHDMKRWRGVWKNDQENIDEIEQDENERRVRRKIKN